MNHFRKTFSGQKLMARFRCLCLLALLTSLPLSAQNYRVLGFSGKDTITVGTATRNTAGRIILNTKDYKGYMVLQPQDAAYTQLVRQLDKMKNIRSEVELNAVRTYITEKLDFDELSHSGLWKDYLQYWVGFYIQASKSPDEFARAFVPIAKKVLGRVSKKNAHTASLLTKDLLEFFEQYNLQQAAGSVAAFSAGLDLGVGEHSDIAARLVTAMKLVGEKAPVLTTASGKIAPKSALLIFHEIGCGNCSVQIGKLKAQYAALQRKGYDVITITGEFKSEEFVKDSNTYPWRTKIWEKESFNSQTFKAYGVASTPTIYVVNKDGIISGRYAQVEETGLLN